MEIAKFVAIGLVVGALSGMLGIGGGVLLVPALMWLCSGFDAKKATGTSLAILIPPIGLPAAWRAYNEDQVDLTAALWIAGAFMVGAYVSRGLVEYVPVHWFRLAFGLMMILVAIRFILDSSSETASAAAGLTAATIALLGYFAMKILGRRHLTPPPTLAEHIQQKHAQRPLDSDYQI